MHEGGVSAFRRSVPTNWRAASVIVVSIGRRPGEASRSYLACRNGQRKPMKHDPCQSAMKKWNRHRTAQQHWLSERI